MGAVAEDGHDSAVEADDEQDSRIPGRARGGDTGHHSRRKPRGSGDADRRRKEFVIHVTGMSRAGRNYCSCHSVDRVAGRHDAAVQVVRDIMCRVGGTPPARRSRRGVGNAGVGGRGSICNVFERGSWTES
jgi:hypothetical protein